MTSERQTSYIFLFIGFFLICLGGWMFYYYHHALDHFIPTSAQVTQVDGVKRGKVRFMAAYKADDAKFVGAFMRAESAGAINEHQGVTIRYDPTNPRDSFYETPIAPSLPYTFTAVGLILWFSGGWGLVRQQKRL